MIWLATYSATAVIVGAALFVFAEFLRRPGTPASPRPGLWATAGGLLWPVLVIGVAQWWLLVALGRRLARTTVTTADLPASVVRQAV